MPDTENRRRRRKSIVSPSPHDPTVSYDRSGTAVNGEVAVLTGFGNDIAVTALHSGVSQAVIGTLADFEDSRGRSLAERSPADWAQTQAEAAAIAVAGGRPPKPPRNMQGLDCYEVDRHGCWIWRGAFKGRWKTPMFDLKSARRLVYLRERGLTENEAPARFVHAACGERRCVCPEHTIWRSGSRLPQALLRLEIRAGA